MPSSSSTSDRQSPFGETSQRSHTSVERSRSKGKRGPSRTSCSECRRCKLRCDGKIPCQQCIKRGYGHMCPDGPVQSGPGQRVFWDAASDLRAKIVVYRDRIRDLEDALRSAHSVVSHHPHPLLSEDLLRIKDAIQFPDTEIPQLSESIAPVTAENELSERFGSLSLSHDGNSKFFGHAANGWMFMDVGDVVFSSWSVLKAISQNDEGNSNETHPASSIGLRHILPPELLLQIGISLSDLTGHRQFMTREDELQLLVNVLPQEQHARQVTNNAFNYGFISFQPIQPDEYNSKIHDPLYQQYIQLDHPLLAVRLAVMYALLAHGAQSGAHVDRSEAERYLHLSRAAMVHSRLVESPTIEGIQALFITTIYLIFSGTASQDTSNLRWSLTGLMMRLCQIVGLHSDPSRYNLSPVEMKRRRLLFGEVYMNDMTQAFLFSRPPAITKEFFDVKPHSDENMSPETNYHLWKYKYGLECLSVVQAQAFSASPPSYCAVLALSKKVEDYPTFAAGDTEADRERHDHAQRHLQAQLSRGHKEDVLLHMHRRFCLIATEKYQDDPLQCEYGSSVLAAYRAAHRLLAYGEILFAATNHPINRAWALWARWYDSATVLGTLVIRCPQLPFAADAYNQLRMTCSMVHSVRQSLEAEKAYDKLMKTLDLAHKSMFAYINKLPVPQHMTTGEAEMLLAKLGAKPQITFRPEVRLLDRGEVNTAENSLHTSRETSIVPLSFPPTSTAGYHPNVVEYLKNHPDPIQLPANSMFTLSPLVTEWGLPSDNSLIPTGLVVPSEWTPGSLKYDASGSFRATEDQQRLGAAGEGNYSSAAAILGFRSRMPLFLGEQSYSPSSAEQSNIVNDGFVPFI